MAVRSADNETIDSMTAVSIIVPVLNEAENLKILLQSLPQNDIQVIVVDGGSTDKTCEVAASFEWVNLIHSAPGRANQMNLGAAVARGDVLLFLHVDTTLPEDFLRHIRCYFLPSRAAWGRFDIKMSGAHWMFRVIETMMNLRSQLTGICTGDQAIFVRREVFNQIGGFPGQPLMEDIAISKALKIQSAPYCIHTKLITSSRRWEARGIFKTIGLMWRLRLMYFFGTPAEKLVKLYYQ